MQSERVSWPAETSHGAGTHQLFLREEELRLAQDLLFFAYRDFTASADAALEELGFGRAHHRALHFIARNPDLTVSDLLSILRITKQSLARVLGNLVDRGYVMQSPGNEDRRQRLLRLTESGESLERRLFERQKAILTAAYRESGGHAVEGFRRVLYSLAGKDARTCIDQADPAFRNRRKI